MRLLVCGGRKYADVDFLAMTLSRIHAKRPITVLIAGGATGADQLAAEWAHQHGIQVEEYKADWKELGPSAGPKRNARMLSEGSPDGVVVFPGGAGTADMVRKARKAGVTVWCP